MSKPNPRLDLLYSQFLRLSGEFPGLYHVAVWPELEWQVELDNPNQPNGQGRLGAPRGLWLEILPYNEIANWPLSSSWLQIDGQLSETAFFDNHPPPRHRGQRKVIENRRIRSERANELRTAIREFSNLAAEAADCIEIADAGIEFPRQPSLSDRWLECAYQSISPRVEVVVIDKQSWCYKTLPANVFECSSLVLETKRADITEISVQATDSVSQKQNGPSEGFQFTYNGTTHFIGKSRNWDLLEYLWKYGNKAVPFGDIGDEVWGNDLTKPSTIRSQIARLNAKFVYLSIPVSWETSGEHAVKSA